MKKFMRSIFLCFVTFLFAPDLYAQNYWKGGTPGKETDWNTAKNWSQNRIPDWTQDVVIPDVSTQSGYFPIITQTVDAIPHLEIQGNATLTILSTGRLFIDGETNYNSGIHLIGKLISKGEIDIMNTAFMEVDQQGGQLLLENKSLAVN